MEEKETKRGETEVAAKRTGRKPWYNSPEEMEEKIEAYFKDCEGHLLFDDDGKPYLDKWGNPIIIGAHPPTVTGLALALGFTSRQALLNYQAKKAFVDTVTRAKSRIEEYAERRLYDRDGARGAEFNLRYNFKWAAEEKETGGEGGGVVLLAPVMEAPDESPASPAEDGGGDR